MLTSSRGTLLPFPARRVRHAHVNPSPSQFVDHLVDPFSTGLEETGACDPMQIVVALIGWPLLERQHQTGGLELGAHSVGHLGQGAFEHQHRSDLRLQTAPAGSQSARRQAFQPGHDAIHMCLVREAAALRDFGQREIAVLQKLDRAIDAAAQYELVNR
jgi:hypothetical protein